MQKWLFNLIQNFIIGGCITASTSYLATFLSPVLAAIWWAFPISLIPSMFYMHQQNKDNKYISKFVITTTYALGVLFFTTMAMGYFYKYHKTGFWLPIFKAISIWAVLGGLYYYVVKYFDLEKKF